MRCFGDRDCTCVQCQASRGEIGVAHPGGLEEIVAAAVHKDGVVYFVARPGRHHDAIYKAHRALGLREHPMEPLCEESQGFVTSRGRYVDRKRALQIANAAKQTKKVPGDSAQLYSVEPLRVGA